MADNIAKEPETTDPAAEPAAEEQEASAVEALRREKDVLQDRLLRTAAEFDNYRKRIERERREQADAATADALIERALQAPAGVDADPFRKGVELIHRQMLDLLRKRGVKPIEAVGADFDPRYHESVMSESSSDHREGEVLEELRRGYKLGDRLLRPAMVKVAKA
jgi:molecular chaperone GrpE